MVAKPVLSIALVTCHQFGKAAAMGIRSSSAFRNGCVELEYLITLPSAVAIRLVGYRAMDASSLSPLFRQTVEVGDATLHPLLYEDVLERIDVLIVAGWPRLISGEVLAAFRTSGKRLALGMHPSPLPHGRGQSPVSWTVLSSMVEAAVTVFDLEALPDAGPVRLVERMPLGANETARSVYGKALYLHAAAARKVADALVDTFPPSIKQDIERVVTWPRLSELDHVLKLNRPRAEVLRLVQALAAPYAGAIDPVSQCRVVRAKVLIANSPNEDSRDYWTVRAATDGDVLLQLERQEQYNNRAREEAQMERGILDAELQEREPERKIARRYSGVLLVAPDGRVALQRRDQNEGIVNPGMITAFGGVNENGESDLNCAVREIQEELEIELRHDQVELLGFVDKLERDASITRCVMFVARNIDVAHAVLNEGAAIEMDRIAKFIRRADVSPVCQLALLALDK